MSKDGKIVACEHVPSMLEGIPAEVSRTTCLLKAKEQCGTCPNSRVVLRFQLRVVDQVVACPRWESEEDRRERRDPLDYVEVRRDTCIRVKPFDHCDSCPNSSAGELPRIHARWFEEEERRRRIERELDEEERGR